jgi:hypothetical protein
MEMKEPLEGQEGLLVGLEEPFRESERASTTIASRSGSETSEAIAVTKAFASGKTLIIAAFDSTMMEKICKAEGVAQETAVKFEGAPVDVDDAALTKIRIAFVHPMKVSVFLPGLLDVQRSAKSCSPAENAGFLNRGTSASL